MEPMRGASPTGGPEESKKTTDVKPIDAKVSGIAKKKFSLFSWLGKLLPKMGNWKPVSFSNLFKTRSTKPLSDPKLKGSSEAILAKAADQQKEAVGYSKGKTPTTEDLDAKIDSFGKLLDPRPEGIERGRTANVKSKQDSVVVGTVKYNGKKVNVNLVFDGNGDPGDLLTTIQKDFLKNLQTHINKNKAGTLDQALQKTLQGFHDTFVEGSWGGTTVTGSLVLGDQALIVNIGDSRTLFSEGDAEKPNSLTVEHNWIHELEEGPIKNGDFVRIGDNSLRVQSFEDGTPFRAVCAGSEHTRLLGYDRGPIFQLDMVPYQIDKPGYFVSFSDGIGSVYTDAQVHQMIRGMKEAGWSTQEMEDALITAAYQIRQNVETPNGLERLHDDLSVVIFEVNPQGA